MKHIDKFTNRDLCEASRIVASGIESDLREFFMNDTYSHAKKLNGIADRYEQKTLVVGTRRLDHIKAYARDRVACTNLFFQNLKNGDI